MTDRFSSRVAIAGAAAVVVFDAAASAAVKVLDFRYGDLVWLSFAIYATAGFMAARNMGSVSAAALTAGLVGLADATVGWAVSYAIEPGLYGYVDDLTVPLIGLVIILVVATAILIGAVGGALAKRLTIART